MKYLEKILQYRDVLYIIGLIILMIFLMNKCSAYRSAQEEIKRQENNVSALTDSLNVYTDELGRLNAEKHAFQLTQKEFEDSIGKIEQKHREYVSYLRSQLGVNDTVYIFPEIERTEKDTNYVDNGTIVIDTLDVYSDHSRREITVRIPFVVDSLLRTGECEIAISQDIFVEGWLEVDTKTGETYLRLRTDYPNLTFNSGMGIVATSSKEYDIKMRKRNGVGIFVGPSVNAGYDPIHGTLSPTVGFSIGFGYTFTPKRLQWGK